jgi:hypothetical protein
MKQLLLLTTITLFSISAFSQLNKKQFLVGGNASFSSTNYNRYMYFEKYCVLQLTSGVGYFIFNKLAVGTDIGLTFYRSSDNTSESKNTSLNMSPFIRYYAFAKNSRVNFFGEVEYNYSIEKDKAYNISDSIPQKPFKKTEMGFSYKVGPVFFINPSVALELSLSYSTSKNKYGYEKASSFLTGLGFQIHLGNKKNKS